MTPEQYKTLLDTYNLALAGKITEQEIKVLIQVAAIEMDRTFVRGEDTGYMKKYYNELNRLIEAYVQRNENS